MAHLLRALSILTCLLCGGVEGDLTSVAKGHKAGHGTAGPGEPPVVLSQRAWQNQHSAPLPIPAHTRG